MGCTVCKASAQRLAEPVARDGGGNGRPQKAKRIDSRTVHFAAESPQSTGVVPRILRDESQVDMGEGAGDGAGERAGGDANESVDEGTQCAHEEHVTAEQPSIATRELPNEALAGQAEVEVEARMAPSVDFSHAQLASQVSTPPQLEETNIVLPKGFTYEQQPSKDSLPPQAMTLAPPPSRRPSPIETEHHVELPTLLGSIRGFQDAQKITTLGEGKAAQATVPTLQRASRSARVEGSPFATKTISLEDKANALDVLHMTRQTFDTPVSPFTDPRTAQMAKATCGVPNVASRPTWTRQHSFAAGGNPWQCVGSRHSCAWGLGECAGLRVK
mmetsp:Transcript_87712/g.246413  ORF Transcript_87712/g.246413 Transcript_87712/m.246413 type:complete len:330 (-) Transcript_87712:128-1117(-)